MLFKKSPRYYLSIVSPVKDETDYIKEFVEYYLMQGVEHFYFYDNDSLIPLSETLYEYAKYCTIINFPGEAVQFRVYEHWLKNFRDETEWIAVFDIDEFIVTKKHLNFIDYLKHNESFDAIVINWLMFGSYPHKQKPNGLVIENYLYSEGRQHSFFKTVSKSKAIKKMNHCHFPELKKGYSIRNPKGEIVTKSTNDTFCHDIIQLNHYFTKSEEEYLRKIRRKRADSGKARIDHVEDHDWVFTAHLLPATRNTDIIDKYLNLIKSKTDSIEKRK